MRRAFGGPNPWCVTRREFGARSGGTVAEGCISGAMNTKTFFRVSAGLLLCAGALGITACAPSASSQVIGGDVIAPVTLEANDLQGATVQLVVGQVLNISTGSLAVDSFQGEVSDTAVAEFSPGSDDGTVQLNPGVSALAPGAAKVTMINDQGGIQPLQFTVSVTAR